MALVSPNSGDIIQASHITQLTGLVAGTSGKGQVVNLTDVGSSAWNSANSGSDASTLWALTVRNQDATNGQAFRVQNSSGTTLFAVKNSQIAMSSTGSTPIVFDTTLTPAGPRMYISEEALTKTALLLGRGGSSGITPDSSYPSLLLAQSYQKDGGEAIKGSAYAVGAQASAGFITGVQGLAEATTASPGWSAPGSGTYGLIGLLGNAQSYKAGARLWGGNVVARQLSGSGSSVTGLEVDVETVTTTQDRYGILVVTASAGTTYGTGEDIGLKFANKNTTANNRWRDAVISFSSENDLLGAGWPAQSTATLIKAYDPDASGVAATDGIDLSVVTFSGASLRMPGFVVGPTGRVAVKTTAVSGVAPLRLNADGDTYNFLIDNAVVAGSAGSDSGNYMTVSLSGTTYKIKLYANA